MLSAIANCRHLSRDAPFHVKGDLRSRWSDGWNRKTGKPKAIGQRVREVVVIVDLQPAHTQARLPVIEINIHGVVRDPNHPEHIVPVDVDVVVVDLRRRSDRTRVQVQSDKGERALVLMPIRTDELALAEAHVRLIRESRHGVRLGVCSSPLPANVRQADEPVEICNLGRVVEHGQRVRGVQRIVVNEDRKGSKWRDAPRDRIGLPVLALLLFVGGMGRSVIQETGSKHRAGAGRLPEESAP